MALSLRDIIETWHRACCHLEKMQLHEALLRLQAIESPTAKIVHNIGCTFLLQNSLECAIKSFELSTEKDKHLALSYFTMGLCHHHLLRYSEALSSFKVAKSLIKGSEINYKQLGAPVVLTSHLVNSCMDATKECISKKRHCELPDVPIMDCVFRPPKSMVDNLVKQDFLGKAKIVSSTEPKDAGETKGQQPSVQHQFHSAPDFPSKDAKTIPSPPNRPPPRQPNMARTEPPKSIAATAQATSPSAQIRNFVSKISHLEPVEGQEIKKVVPVPYHVTTFHGALTHSDYSVPGQRPAPAPRRNLQVKKSVEVDPYLITDLSKYMPEPNAPEKYVASKQFSCFGQEAQGTSSPLRPVNKPTRPPPPVVFSTPNVIE